MPEPAATFPLPKVGNYGLLPNELVENSLSGVLLDGMRQRNRCLDAIFYDVNVITQEEVACISPQAAAEGSILAVPPTGQGQLTVYPSVEDFAQSASDITALCVAGVGSSALGTAAFARNVADALGRPVAGVVSGYGLVDVAAEAVGGYFMFGSLNSLRELFQPLIRVAEAGFIPDPTVLKSALGPARNSDMETVIGLLEHPDLSFDFAAGHSKGGLVLSEALFQMKNNNLKGFKEVGRRMQIVTLGALIAMPYGTTDVIDIIGELDWYGALNSRGFVEPDVVAPRAWHHTNTKLPAHLPVTETLRSALGI